jgi:hypothetical protein
VELKELQGTVVMANWMQTSLADLKKAPRDRRVREARQRASSSPVLGFHFYDSFSF